MDEAFYPTIAYRFLQGDRILYDEWNNSIPYGYYMVVLNVAGARKVWLRAEFCGRKRALLSLEIDINLDIIRAILLLVMGVDYGSESRYHGVRRL